MANKPKVEEKAVKFVVEQLNTLYHDDAKATLRGVNRWSANMRANALKLELAAVKKRLA